VKILYINTIKYTLHKEFKSLSNARSYFATRHLSGVEQKVFLKRLEFSLNYKNLYKILIDLHNQNLAKIFEIGDDGHFFYVVQEWIEGLTLRDIWSYLIDDSKGSHKEIETLLLVWIYEISLALETLQGAQPPLAHNDLAPHNIMVRKQDCSAILVDFDHASTMGSRPQSFVNPLYSPPSESIHKNTISFQTDIYSLAKVVEKLMGSKMSEDLQKLVSLCTQNSEIGGPQSAIELRQMLENFLREVSGETLSRPELMKFRGALLEKAWPKSEGVVQENKSERKIWQKILWSSRQPLLCFVGLMGFVRPLGSGEAIPISAVVLPWGVTGVKDRAGKWIQPPVSGRHFTWHLKPGVYDVESSHPLLGLKRLKIHVIPENPQVFIIDDK